MILSVVMPTCNKQELLSQSLAALLAQEVSAPWEIVVVDDGSRDETPGFLAEQKSLHPEIIKVVAPGKNVGRAAARNLGVWAAEGTWVLFLDDDIVVPAGMLSAHLHCLQKHPGCGTIGLVRTDPRIVDAPHFHYIDSRGVAKIASGPIPARYFVTQNAAVPRESLLAVGGFDERFSAYGMEDMEVAFRLEEKEGVSFLPVLEPVPAHVHYHTLDAYLDKKRECGQGSLPQLARLHPGRIREMKLHWVVDPPGSPPPEAWIKLARMLASGPPARLLEVLVRNWPSTTGNRPVASPVYFRCLDALVLCAYAQGVSSQQPHHDITAD